MSKRIVVFSLQTFSTTGGIQKMTRTLAHSLQQVVLKNNWIFQLWSLYDEQNDLMPQYLPAGSFRGFGFNRIYFIINALKIAPSADVVIISHINLAVVGLAIKLINPKCKVWLIAHGIEVWRPLSFAQKLFAGKCDKIICVSGFTRQEVINRHQIDSGKCVVLNNAVDSFMTPPVTFNKPAHLLSRYSLSPDDTLLFTLTRLATTEQYKGYDQVINILNKIRVKIPSIKYILAGKYDAAEEVRIKRLITDHGVEDLVILTGFIDEAELTDHFTLADLFVLPSKKEGFGIVFVEALACGLPVICGNVDGSLDAIRNGELGKAINPDDLGALEEAITEYLSPPVSTTTRLHLQKECLRYFNEDNYIHKLQQLLNDEPID
jgi:phosphatidylinositol alpha-1,6-mannosyltransferase